MTDHDEDDMQWSELEWQMRDMPIGTSQANYVKVSDGHPFRESWNAVPDVAKRRSPAICR